MELCVDQSLLTSDWLKTVFSLKSGEMTLHGVRKFVFMAYFLTMMKPVTDETIEIPYTKFSFTAESMDIKFTAKSHSILDKVFKKCTKGVIDISGSKTIRPLYSLKSPLEYSGHNIYIETDYLEPLECVATFVVNGKRYDSYKTALTENNRTTIDSREIFMRGGWEESVVEPSVPCVRFSDTQISHTSHINVSLLAHCLGKQNLPPFVRNIMQIIKEETDIDGYIEFQYYQNGHGRNYIHGCSLQQMPKYYRNMLLSEYHECDIKAGTFSILGNYALTFMSPDDIPHVMHMIQDPDGVRKDIRKELKKDDPNVTMDYVKTVLNSICYGAAMSEKLVMKDIERDRKRTVPSITEGYTNAMTPLNIVELPIVKGLAKDIRRICTEACKTQRIDGVLYNSQNQPMRITKHTNQGQKISHLYQSLENDVLKVIFHMPVDGVELCNIRGGIGLLLHDGIYIRKDIYSQIGGSESITRYVKSKTGYEISYK